MLMRVMRVVGGKGRHIEKLPIWGKWSYTTVSFPIRNGSTC